MASDSSHKGNEQTLIDYWTKGDGAAKIKWGAPGDFDRCVTEVTTEAHGKVPDVKGYCANLHHTALGVWPGKEDPKGTRAAAADGMISVPQLVTMPGIDLVATGEWGLSTGPATFTTADLEAAIEASACPAVGQPVIKLGHLDPRFNAATPDDPTHDGTPAIGHVTNMQVTAGGNKITGDLAGMPGWLGPIIASAFPKRSVEGSFNFRCQIGHMHPFVLTGLALLGVTPPGVGVLGGLSDVAALYGVEAAAGNGDTWILEEADMPTQQVLAAGVTTEDVRRAYYGQGATPLSMWITEMQLDPPQLIVCDDSNDAIYRVPVTIKGADVTFGDPVAVQVEYSDVAASRSTGAALVFASAADSRAGITPPETGAPAAPEHDHDHPHDDHERDGSVAAAGADHDPFTGDHSHSHPANGSQGGDSTHTHPHSHAGDADHGHTHTDPGSTSAAAGPTMEGATKVDFTNEQDKALRAALGLADDDELTPDGVVSAAGALKSKADKVSAGARQQLPSGVIAVDKEAWDTLNASVKAGEEFRARTLRGERDQVISEAIRAGKFSAAKRDHWARMWDDSPESTREVLASLQKNVVPIANVGTGDSTGPDDVEDEYVAMFGRQAQ